MKYLALFSLLISTPATAQTLPGYDRFDLDAAHRARPVAASIWYPAGAPTYPVRIGSGPIFEGVPAFVGPAVKDGAHPLILLSHGSGGNADALGWLSSALVARGAMVLAVNHPGSTSGDSSPRRSIDLGARAADLSAALDMVLADPTFGSRVDLARIGAIGFSLGGSTALSLAGLRFDGATQDTRCADVPEAADCGFFLRSEVRFADNPGFGSNGRDARITRVVAIDPGFGGAVNADSLAGIDVQVTFINLGTEDIHPAVDVGLNGNRLALRLSDAELHVVTPASHFTFLAVCQPDAAEILAEEGDDPICDDPDGTDRRAVHAQLADLIAEGIGLR